MVGVHAVLHVSENLGLSSPNYCPTKVLTHTGAVKSRGFESWARDMMEYVYGPSSECGSGPTTANFMLCLLPNDVDILFGDMTLSIYRQRPSRGDGLI